MLGKKLKNEWENHSDFFAEYSENPDLNCKKFVFPRIIELIGNIKGKSLLDFGCGVGTFARQFRDLGAEVVAYDSALNMIQTAKLIGENTGIQYVNNINNTKLIFDIVFCQMVLVANNENEVHKIVKQISHLLKKEGMGIFINTNPKTIGNKFKDFYSLPVKQRTNGAPYRTIIQSGCKRITCTDYFYSSQYLSNLFLDHGLKRMNEEIVKEQYLLQITQKER